MRNIDVSQAIDQGPFGRFQWMVVALCGALLIVDGYDVFVAGTVLPFADADVARSAWAELRHAYLPGNTGSGPTGGGRR